MVIYKFSFDTFVQSSGTADGSICKRLELLDFALLLEQLEVPRRRVGDAFAPLRDPVGADKRPRHLAVE